MKHLCLKRNAKTSANLNVKKINKFQTTPLITRLWLTHSPEALPQSNVQSHSRHIHNKKTKNKTWFTSPSSHLDKCYFALADITVYIFDGHLSVMLNPALTTEDVVDAGCHFVPFVVVPKAGEITDTLSLLCQKHILHCAWWHTHWYTHKHTHTELVKDLRR